jgi:hypothetical protein
VPVTDPLSVTGWGPAVAVPASRYLRLAGDVWGSVGDERISSRDAAVLAIGLGKGVTKPALIGDPS